MLKKFGYLFVFFLFARGLSAQALKLPCWNKAECFAPVKTTKAFSGLAEQRPAWHKSLDDITFYMRPDTDYSILFNNQKDRVPLIHTRESGRAVEELAGDVISDFLSPITYRIPFFANLNSKKNELNSIFQSSIPETHSGPYTVSIQPRVDLSRDNPASLDFRVKDGREIGVISLRLYEAEASIPVMNDVSLRGGYSFRDSVWYAYFAGRITLWR